MIEAGDGEGVLIHGGEEGQRRSDLQVVPWRALAEAPAGGEFPLGVLNA